MTIFEVFSLLGGLAFFLFGMNVMGEGLEKQAGHRLRVILEKLTTNPVKGFFLGLFVTSIIQSSSAVTVMVVGFVNSGIMSLMQSTGVIIGANVGTTVTAWILSLAGIEGDAIWIKLMKPSSFAPVLSFIGILMIMFARKNKRKDTGTILLGFGITMIGMLTMGDAVQPLANQPSFREVFLLFENPLLGILVGTLFTGIIQSSSASIGVLQALTATGAISYASAIPLILGQNIGSCGSALLASIGANKPAKRAAWVHMYFNIIGTILYLIVFYSLDMFFDFNFMEAPINGFGVAIAHTIFNVSMTLILLPARKVLVKLANLTIKEDASEAAQFELLDERLFATPAVAVERSRALIKDMGKIAEKTINKAIANLDEFKEKRAKKVLKNEDTLDQYEDKIGTYLVHLSGQNLSAKDNYEVSRLLYLIGDFERIGDHAVNILKVAEEMNEKKLEFSDEAQGEVNVIRDALQEVLRLATAALVDDDLAAAKLVEPLEEVIDDLTKEAKLRHIVRLQKGECTIELGFILSDLLTDYERVADHCSNIAAALIESAENNLDRHAYLHDLKDSGTFEELYEQYHERFKLPAPTEVGESARAVAQTS